jgi:hypothetical protein
MCRCHCNHGVGETIGHGSNGRTCTGPLAHPGRVATSGGVRHQDDPDRGTGQDVADHSSPVGGEPATPPEGDHVGPFGAGHRQDLVGRPSTADLQVPSGRRGVAGQELPRPGGVVVLWPVPELRHGGDVERAGSRSRRLSRRTSAWSAPRHGRVRGAVQRHQDPVQPSRRRVPRFRGTTTTPCSACAWRCGPGGGLRDRPADPGRRRAGHRRLSGQLAVVAGRGLKPWRPLTLFYQYASSDPLGRGLDRGDAAVLSALWRRWRWPRSSPSSDVTWGREDRVDCQPSRGQRRSPPSELRLESGLGPQDVVVAVLEALLVADHLHRAGGELDHLMGGTAQQQAAKVGVPGSRARSCRRRRRAPPGGWCWPVRRWRSAGPHPRRSRRPAGVRRRRRRRAPGPPLGCHRRPLAAAGGNPRGHGLRAPFRRRRGPARWWRDRLAGRLGCVHGEQDPLQHRPPPGLGSDRRDHAKGDRRAG